MKHTKGPWTVDIIKDAKKKQIHMNIGNEGSDICVAYNAWPYGDNAEFEANAHLIAAAPELLHIVEEFIACGPNAGHNRELIELALTALNKAKGE